MIKLTTQVPLQVNKSGNTMANQEGSILEEGEIQEDIQRSADKKTETRSEDGGVIQHGKRVIFFVSNIPGGCSRGSLLGIFEEYGDVFDIYIAKKKDKAGRIFGFVKYRNVKDDLLLEESLQKLTVHNTRLVVFRAKFDRYGNKMEYSPSHIQHVPESGAPFQSVNQLGGLNQSCRNAPISGAPMATQAIKIPSDVVAHSDRFNSTLVGRVVDFLTLRNIHNYIVVTKFQGLSIRYLGGFYVMLTFSDPTDSDEFLKAQETWSKWFSSLARWVGQSISYERIAWIRILGVPPHLWDKSVLDAIGNHVGKVIQGSQVSWEEANWSQDCIGILVGEGCQIKDEINLLWRDKSYRLWIIEEPGEWLPDCLEKIPQPTRSDCSQPTSNIATDGVTSGADRPAIGALPHTNFPREYQFFEVESATGCLNCVKSSGERKSSHGNVRYPFHENAIGDECLFKPLGEVNPGNAVFTPSKSLGPFVFMAGPSNSKRARPKSSSPLGCSSPTNSFNLSFIPQSKKRSRIDNDPFHLDELLGLNNLQNSINPSPNIPKTVEPPTDPDSNPQPSSFELSVGTPTEQSKIAPKAAAKNGLVLSSKSGDSTTCLGVGNNGAGYPGRKQRKGVKTKRVKVVGVSAPAPPKTAFTFPLAYPP